MELAKIVRMFDSSRRYSAFRIVGLMFKGAEPIDRSHKIVGLERVRGKSGLFGMTECLYPFLRCFCEQVGQCLQCIKRLAMQFIQTEEEGRVFQFVRCVVCALASTTAYTEYSGRRRTASRVSITRWSASCSNRRARRACLAASCVPA